MQWKITGVFLLFFSPLCMKEIKVFGLILPTVLWIKVALFPWTPDRLATSKLTLRQPDSSERTFVNMLGLPGERLKTGDGKWRSNKMARYKRKLSASWQEPPFSRLPRRLSQDPVGSEPSPQSADGLGAGGPDRASGRQSDRCDAKAQHMLYEGLGLATTLRQSGSCALASEDGVWIVMPSPGVFEESWLECPTCANAGFTARSPRIPRSS